MVDGNKQIVQKQPPLLRRITSTTVVILLFVALFSGIGGYWFGVQEEKTQLRQLAGPINESDAVLGGTVKAFTAKYGSGTNPGTGLNMLTYTLPPTAELDIQTYHGGDLNDNGRVSLINIYDISKTEPNWEVEEAKAICRTFLPHDAVYKGLKPYESDSYPVAFLQEVYTSDQLSNTFPSSYFTESGYPAASHPIKRPAAIGTLSISYSYMHDTTPGRTWDFLPNKFHSCTLQLGTSIY